VSVEQRILDLPAFADYNDRRELRAIALEVRKLEDRIKQLEDRIHRAASAFFRDGSDGQVASGMLAILEEERGKK
jgi:transcription elongation GreA/GreB family factor